MTSPRRFAINMVLIAALGIILGRAIRDFVDARRPEPEPRCMLDRIEYRPPAALAGGRTDVAFGGGRYEIWSCDGFEIAILKRIGP